jgi:hypothetical protein
LGATGLVSTTSASFLPRFKPALPVSRVSGILGARVVLAGCAEVFAFALLWLLTFGLAGSSARRSSCTVDLEVASEGPDGCEAVLRYWGWGADATAGLVTPERSQRVVQPKCAAVAKELPSNTTSAAGQ